MAAAQILTVILAAAGMIVMLVSLIGLIRFPDFFTRLHAQGIGDTLGALLIILAMMTATGAHIMSVKLFLIFLVIMFTNPIGTNLMMIAAIFYTGYQDYKWLRPGSRREEPEKPEKPKKTEIPAKTITPETAKPEKTEAPEKPVASEKPKTSTAELKPSMKRTRTELLSIAEGMGIDVPEFATKKGILELIYQNSPELRPKPRGSKPNQKKRAARTGSEGSAKEKSKGGSKERSAKRTKKKG